MLCLLSAAIYLWPPHTNFTNKIAENRGDEAQTP